MNLEKIPEGAKNSCINLRALILPPGKFHVTPMVVSTVHSHPHPDNTDYKFYLICGDV